MSRLKAVNILSCLLPVGMGEERVDENGIHDVNMRENGVVNGGNSTPNVPDDVRGRGSEKSGSGVVKGGQGLGDSFWIIGGGLSVEVIVVWKTVRSWDESYHDDNGRQRGARGMLGTIKLHRTTWEHRC